MSQDVHVETLKTRHADLETRLQSELVRPHPDASRVAALKREKLRIKDEIARLTH